MGRFRSEDYTNYMLLLDTMHIFFCSSEHIHLGRRFASDFLIETDATLNTNRLGLPLTVLINVTNTGSTFPRPTASSSLNRMMHSNLSIRS